MYPAIVLSELKIVSSYCYSSRIHNYRVCHLTNYLKLSNFRSSEEKGKVELVQRFN